MILQHKVRVDKLPAISVDEAMKVNYSPCFQNCLNIEGSGFEKETFMGRSLWKAQKTDEENNVKL